MNNIKINKLEIENVKRIKAVKIEPSSNGLTIVGGDNNQGKTSVLDSIAWALGGEKYRPSQAVREGSVIPPNLHIVMSNGLVVERKGKNSALKVTDPEGNKAGQMCIEHICAKHHKDGLESFGYGSGYIYVREEFGRFLNRLEEVIEYGVNVVLIAHAQLRKFEQPDEMGAYDRWELKLGKKTASQISPLVKEWSDALLFVNYKTYSIAVDDKGKKHKAQGGKRVMYTSHHPCWDAKNRYNLPEECDFDYSVIAPILNETSSKIQNSVPKQPVQEKKEHQSTLPDFMSIPGDIDEEVDFHPEAEKKDQIPEAFKLPKSIPVALRDLMEVNLVSEEEIQTVVAQKGYFPKDTPIQNYPEEFINGSLVGAWKQVYQCIEALRASYDVPFN